MEHFQSSATSFLCRIQDKQLARTYGLSAIAKIPVPLEQEIMTKAKVMGLSSLSSIGRALGMVSLIQYSQVFDSIMLFSGVDWS